MTAKIEISGASKKFGAPGGPTVHAMGPVDMSIKDGEFVTIVGPSGCGKSTLLYILGGFVESTSGSLLLDGRQITRPGTDRGVVFQEYALFPWLSVYENIAFALRRQNLPEQQVRDIVMRYVEVTGLQGFEGRFPKELSGGMKQRVALARTFAYSPEVLLLDEPFGALDAQTREIMQDELLRLWRSERKTVVMVTHDVDEAVYLSNRVCVMSQRPGRVVEQFDIDIDRSGEREEIVLSEAYRTLRNQVWISVRNQVKRAAAEAA